MAVQVETPRWHQALALALTGRQWPELGRQDRPDLDLLVQTLQGHLVERVAPVPPELMAGLGAAQFHAAVSQLRQRLTSGSTPMAPVLADRPLTADECRLLRDVPPHHA